MRRLRTQARSLIRSSVRPLPVLICAGILLGTVGASADSYYAIVWNLTGAKRPEAHLEVSGDSATLRDGIDVLFNVYGVNGIQVSEFSVPANSRSFVSTASAAAPTNNLFDLSLGQPVLVKARTPDGNGHEIAVLRQTLGNSIILLNVPGQFGQNLRPVSVGTSFPVTIGDFSRAALLVANVTGNDVTVDVFVGTKGPDGAGKYGIPRLLPNSIGILQITDPADANSHLLLSSTGDIVAQLAIDTGKQIHELTMLIAR